MLCSHSVISEAQTVKSDKSLKVVWCLKYGIFFLLLGIQICLHLCRESSVSEVSRYESFVIEQTVYEEMKCHHWLHSSKAVCFLSLLHSERIP